MADQMSRTTVPAPPTRLEPDAIGVAQDTIIGMATSAPAVVVAFSLAALASAANYGGGASLVICAIPMLIIANAYRRLNMWNANSGASFEWVGRAISPYLGFFTGWLMIVGYVIGTLSGVVGLGPSVLAVFNNNANSTWGNILIATVIGVLMVIIAVIGIKLTARVQVVMALIEYAILVILSVWGLSWVLGHHAGTVSFSSGWLTPTGIGGHGELVGGFLIAVFAFSGWDGTVYVNEEVKHRRINPGRAAVFAALFLTVLYVLAQVGLQGVVPASALQAHSDSAVVYVAQTMGGTGWGDAAALAIALSGIATTGTGIVVGARIIYGMASYRALPEFLANVPRRFSTPAAASVAFGLVVVVLTWIYLLSSSVADAFTNILDLTGVLFAIFYVLTALASMAYYRRRVLTRPGDALMLGILPLASAAFLVWMVVKSMLDAPASQVWTLVGIIVAGVILMFVAKFVLRSPFFNISREADSGRDEVPVRA
ncbi:MAG TPA: APC family permease [Trebonia sp.]|jgi:amino acid transporter|nr:APC family permease [Trebonia sp.]